MKKDLIQTAKIITLGAILALGVSFAHAVWVGPTAPPPLNNASAPINVGNTTQTKAGDIILDDGVNTAGLVADTLDASIVTAASKFCIGPSCITAWPSGGGGGNSDFSAAGTVKIIEFCPTASLNQNNCKNSSQLPRGVVNFISPDPTPPSDAKGVILYVGIFGNACDGLPIYFYAGDSSENVVFVKQIQNTLAHHSGDSALNQRAKTEWIAANGDLILPLTNGVFGVYVGHGGLCAISLITTGFIK